MMQLLDRSFALLCGGALGAFFFVGLWWTIRLGLSSKQPALWFLGSLLVRTSATVAGFYFLSRGHWDRLLLGLLGFGLARFIVTRLTQQASMSRSVRTERPEPVIHAP